MGNKDYSKIINSISFLYANYIDENGEVVVVKNEKVTFNWEMLFNGICFEYGTAESIEDAQNKIDEAIRSLIKSFNSLIESFIRESDGWYVSFRSGKIEYVAQESTGEAVPVFSSNPSFELRRRTGFSDNVYYYEFCDTIPEAEEKAREWLKKRVDILNKYLKKKE